MAEQTPPEERADAEHLADALLAAAEADAETTSGERDLPDVLHTAYQRAAAAVVSRAFSR
jgi:hypothetical protein